MATESPLDMHERKKKVVCDSGFRALDHCHGLEAITRSIMPIPYHYLPVLASRWAFQFPGAAGVLP